jgi:hypothetical protein
MLIPTGNRKFLMFASEGLTGEVAANQALRIARDRLVIRSQAAHQTQRISSSIGRTESLTLSCKDRNEMRFANLHIMCTNFSRASSC